MASVRLHIFNQGLSENIYISVIDTYQPLYTSSLRSPKLSPPPEDNVIIGVCISLSTNS